MHTYWIYGHAVSMYFGQVYSLHTFEDCQDIVQKQTKEIFEVGLVISVSLNKVYKVNSLRIKVAWAKSAMISFIASKRSSSLLVTLFALEVNGVFVLWVAVCGS